MCAAILSRSTQCYYVIGMEISTEKSTINVSNCQDVKVDIEMNVEQLEDVRYLSAIIPADGSSYKVSRARIGLATACMAMLN